MTGRPIIFSAPMVKSLIAGTKTQTRRVLKPQPECNAVAIDYALYEVGDRLWVREGWKVLGRESDGETELAMEYLADGAKYKFTSPEEWGATLAAWRSRGAVKRPSIHMPRWASRTTLTVTDVRVQRLQEISEEDARAEGCGLYVPGHGFITTDELRGDPGYSNFLSPRLGFEATWNSLHGKDAWSINPWIAALTFAVEHRNIDAVAVMTRPAPDTLVLTEGER